MTLRLVAVAVLALAVAGSASGAGSGTIVFWNDNPYPSIWSLSGAGGAGPHKILRNKQNAKRPRLSPDRRWVVFDGAAPPKRPMSDFDIQIVRVDGTQRRTLTSSRPWDLDAQWSPDGKWIAFTRNPPSPRDCGRSSIWLIRPSGKDAHPVGAGCGARWSPDGTRLALTSRDGKLQVLELASGGVTTILERERLLQPNAWTRDGKRILVTTLTSTGSSGTMLLVDSDGANTQTVGSGYGACFSPDGRRILFTTAFTSPLYVVNLDGSGRRVLARVIASEPDWR